MEPEPDGTCSASRQTPIAKMFRVRRRREMLLVQLLFICTILFIAWCASAVLSGTGRGLAAEGWAPASADHPGRRLMAAEVENGTEPKNCTAPAVHEFPEDIFTNQERKKGAVLLHIFAALYMFLALAIVCDDYFVTSLEKICEKLHLSEDVAGATFMAAGSSAPELFASIIGVFITHGDVGVGTIVGSAVFNILCIIGVCGLFAGQVVLLTKYSVFRDSLYYTFSVVALIARAEKPPVFSPRSPDTTNGRNAAGSDVCGARTPAGGATNKLKWLVSWPILLLLYVTVPNCAKARWERCFMLSFILSTLWIAAFSYVMVWMVTIIGYTLGIPDVIMGITFLAAGTSVPDCIASLIVARQGLGDMAVSNTVGSNVFDILVGLGVPWAIKTMAVNFGSEVQINSKGLVYSVVLLLGSVALTVLGIHVNRWRLDFKLGVYVMVLYGVFLCFSILIEYNIFTFVNLPMCQEDL
ncbi:sodium/potassium/calcium exchanger 4a [Denticeps clupeoides]|uniref:sodium/potassium/calcium exchanger 4a n=1 Tax=Denticeps clupeoides TaxID=299321 RepID=UPI0010A3F441|nr:sodium/potassium/calcium exchanger 4-like [Denticeps clupeoides]